MKKVEKIIDAAASGNLFLLKILINTSSLSQELIDKILWVATINGRVDVVKYLIELNGNVNKNAGSIYAPVVQAADKGYLNIVKILVENGAVDLNKALEIAANKGNCKIVKYLVSKGATNLNEALFYAGVNGHYGTIQYLLSKGADVNYRKILFHAAQKGYTDIVKMLVENKANINYFVEGNIKYSPISIAAYNGHIEIVRNLIENGAKDLDNSLLLATQKGYLEIVKLLIENKADKNINQGTVNSPIYKAAYNGHYSLVKYFIDLGVADLDMAICAASKQDYSEIVKLLALSGADIMAYNNTPINEAIEFGNIEVVRVLLELGVDVVEDLTPIYTACQNRWRRCSDELYYLLIENGANPNIKNMLKENPKETYEMIKNNYFQRWSSTNKQVTKKTQKNVEEKSETLEQFNSRIIRILENNKVDVEKIISPYFSNRAKVPSVIILFQALPQDVLEKGNDDIKEFVLKLVQIIKQTFGKSNAKYQEYIRINKEWFSKNKNSLLWFKKCILMDLSELRDPTGLIKYPGNIEEFKLSRRKMPTIPENL